MTRVRWLVLISALGTVALAALTALAIAWVAADAALRPDPPRVLPSIDAFPFTPLDVPLVSSDGTHLAGWFVSPSVASRRLGALAPAIVLVHAYGGTRDVLLPQASMLREAGYAVLLFDGRGSGHSSDSTVSFGVHEPQDVSAAVDYLEQRTDVDAERIGVLGVGMGGSVALMAAAEDPRIRAVIAEDPYASLDRLLHDALVRDVGVPAPLRPLTTWLVRRRIGATLVDAAPLEAAARLGDRQVMLIEDSAGHTAGTTALYPVLGPDTTLWVAYGARAGNGLEEFPGEYVVQVRRFLTAAFDAR